VVLTPDWWLLELMIEIAMWPLLVKVESIVASRLESIDEGQ